MTNDAKNMTPVSNPPPGGGDINIGAITASDHFVIGHGAQLIIEQALSRAEEAKKQKEFESQTLAQAVVAYVQKLEAHLDQVKQGVAESEPYKALLPYRIADAPNFFGRDQARKDLLANVSQAGRGPITVLHAESGVGKTSLLQAGLAAAVLANQHLPLYVRPWRRAPTEAIKRALMPNLNVAETPGLAQTSLRAFLTQVTAVLAPTTGLFILLDQFEEFFTRLQDETVRRQFIDELGACVDDEMLRVRFVLSLRDEKFANLSDFRTRIPYIFNTEYALKLLTPDEAARAIREPAQAAHLSYEPGLVEEILAELQVNEQQQINPPQLQLVCWALYQEVRESGQTITAAMLQDLGGVAGILRNYLQRVMEKEFPLHHRKPAQRVLETLVRSDRTRDIKTKEELARLIGSDQHLSQVLDQLVSSRLLRIIDDDDPDTAAAYELAHDYLVPQIELDPETIQRKIAQELLDQEVEARQRNPSSLIGDEKLKIIEAQEKNLYFSLEAEELYRESKKARRRRRFTLFGLLGGVVLAAIIAVLLYGSLSLAQENLGIARNALVTATGVIESAEEEARAAEARRATAETERRAALAAEETAAAAGATARIARATAEARQGTAEAEQATAAAAAQTAAAAEATASEARATAVARRTTAESQQRTAEAESRMAVNGRQTAQANRATAVAEQQQALAAEQTAQAERAEAETAARRAAAARSEAEAARAEAEQARAEAEEAREEAEQAKEEAQEAAEQAEEEKRQAEQAAQNAQATRAVVEILRATAEAELAQTQRAAAIIHNTQFCPAGNSPTPRPIALAYDGTYIWTANLGAETVTQLRAGDCQVVNDYPVGQGPRDIIYAAGYVWVAEQNDNTVRHIDPATGAALTYTVGLGTADKPAALVYDGNLLWVALSSFGASANEVRSLDPKTGAVSGPYPTGRNPAALAYDGTHLWTANQGDHTVSKINPATGPAGVFPVGANPSALFFDGAFVWVANENDNTLMKLQPSDGAILETFAVGDGPADLTFDGTNFWTANKDVSRVGGVTRSGGRPVLDIPTAREPEAILFDGANIWVAAELGNGVQKIPVSLRPVGPEPVALARQGDSLWTTNSEDNSLSQVDLSSQAPARTFALAHKPAALIAAGPHIWVANNQAGTVSKIDGRTGTNLGDFPSGGDNPQALAFDGTFVWVVNEDSNTVARLRESNGHDRETFPTGQEPVDIVYDGGNLWIANYDDQSLLRLNPQNGQRAGYALDGSPVSLVSAGPHIWVNYLKFSPNQVWLRRVLAADGSTDLDIQADISFGDEPRFTYDGTYLWLAEPGESNTPFGQVVRIDPNSAPAGQIPFHVCNNPSDLLSLGTAVWIACQADGVVQKLSGAGGPAAALSPETTLSIKATARLYLPLIVKNR